MNNNSDRLIKLTKSAYNEITDNYSKCWSNDKCMEPFLLMFMDHMRYEPLIVDIGCGTGRDVKYLKKKGARVIGIDISDGMLREARKIFPQGIFSLMDMRYLGLASKTFDGVWASASLLHLPKNYIDYAISEAKRVLKDNGIFFLSLREGQNSFISNEGRLYVYYSKNDISNILNRNNFDIISFNFNLSNKSTFNVPKNAKWMNILAKKRPAFINCPFCTYNSESIYDIQNNYNISCPILFQTEHFFIIPDIAPLSEGHLLIIPKEHYVSIGEALNYYMSEFLSIKQKAFFCLKDAYTAPFFFEHGASHKKRAGNSIDHAHMHCIPSETVIKDSEYFSDWIRIESVQALPFYSKNSLPYLFFENRNGECFLKKLEQYESYLPSQYLRKLFGDLLNAEDWDWKRIITKTNYHESHSSLIHEAANKLQPKFSIFNIIKK